MSCRSFERKDGEMRVLQRQIQEVRPDKWEALEEIDKRFNAIEKRLGFPPNKKRYRCYFGGHDTNTLVVEYEWDSLAAMEAAYEKAMADAEWQALSVEVTSIIKSDQMELYAPLP
jgi:hypothetical protein